MVCRVYHVGVGSRQSEVGTRVGGWYILYIGRNWSLCRTLGELDRKLQLPFPCCVWARCKLGSQDAA